jgi:hypothetical protein
MPTEISTTVVKWLSSPWFYGIAQGSSSRILAHDAVEQILFAHEQKALASNMSMSSCPPKGRINSWLQEGVGLAGGLPHYTLIFLMLNASVGNHHSISPSLFGLIQGLIGLF